MEGITHSDILWIFGAGFSILGGMVLWIMRFLTSDHVHRTDFDRLVTRVDGLTSEISRIEGKIDAIVMGLAIPRTHIGEGRPASQGEN
jgi:hypothetical protein